MTTTPPQVALGTVQWGMAYGIANCTGKASEDDVRLMLRLAKAEGVDTLDTARAYGDAEDVIGRVLAGTEGWRVITKLHPDVCGPGDTAEVAADATERSLQASCNHLGRTPLDAVLLHRPHHRVACDGAVWRSLRAARASGVVRAIGLSATSPQSAMDALDDPEVELMQVAGSLLDRRLVTLGFFERARERGIEVHVRSVFLQGVAFLEPDALPEPLAALAPSLALIDRWAESHGTTRSTAFLAHACGLSASRIVIGCERPDQLEANLAALSPARRLLAEVAALAAELPALPDAAVDPSMWGWVG